MFNNFLEGLSSRSSSNGVTLDEVEATANFENQLGPPPVGAITQTQGDAPTVGYIPPAPPGVGGGMNPPPPPPQQAGMGGGQQSTGDLAYSGSNHPGGARRAAKGNPWRPGKSDVIP